VRLFRFRVDISRVDNFHAENFAEAITWINYRRWWMEFVGFWGPPGTPAPGKATPEGVTPMVFNTQATQAEYQQLYPEGTSTKYYLHTTTSPNEKPPLTPPPPQPTLPPVETPIETPEPTELPITKPIVPPASTPESPSIEGQFSGQFIAISSFLFGFIVKTLFDYIWRQWSDKGYSRIPDAVV
jgi:hypothetical protein